MKHSAPFAALVLMFLAIWLVAIYVTPADAGGNVPGYHPAAFPDAKPTMPLVGINGSGVGYCVTIEGTELRVNVPMHVLDPVKRDQINKRHMVGLEPLSTDPGVIIQEYRVSVQNAFKLLAAMSGDERLRAAAEKPLHFLDLGDGPSLDGAGDTTCMQSTCYGKAPGSGCRPKGCAGVCSDCVTIRVPSME